MRENTADMVKASTCNAQSAFWAQIYSLKIAFEAAEPDALTGVLDALPPRQSGADLLLCSFLPWIEAGGSAKVTSWLHATHLEAAGPQVGSGTINIGTIYANQKCLLEGNFDK